MRPHLSRIRCSGDLGRRRRQRLIGDHIHTYGSDGLPWQQSCTDPATAVMASLRRISCCRFAVVEFRVPRTLYTHGQSQRGALTLHADVVRLQLRRMSSSFHGWSFSMSYRCDNMHSRTSAGSRAHAAGCAIVPLLAAPCFFHVTACASVPNGPAMKHCSETLLPGNVGEGVYYNQG